MEENNNKNNIKQEIQIEEISSINKNKVNSSKNETQNQNSMNLDENVNQNKTFEDEDGNLLDPNDLSYNSEEDKTSIILFDNEIYFSQKIEQVDVVFLLDTTKSINPYLKGIKRYLRKIIFEAKKSISHYLNDDIDVLKLGLVAYRDHDQENVENSYVSSILCDLTEDYNVFRKALYEIKCKGGDDECEAVIDGLHEAVNLISWREDSIKLLYHICGSPCHGAKFKDENSQKKEKYDNYEEGCPCGIDIKNTLKTLRGKYIEYSLILLEEGIEKMATEFSKYIKIELMKANIEKENEVSDNQLEDKDDGDDIIKK
jgi:hypothetical protein